jgi:hypothetical protein
MDFSKFFTRLLECEASLFSRMKILQMCAMGKPTFLLRTHEPDATREAAKRFDLKVDECLSCFIEANVDVSKVSRLPMRLGGLGLRRAEQLCDIAFAARGKGKQREATAILDDENWQSLLTGISEQQAAIVKSFAKVPVIETADDALRLNLRERLLLPTLIAHVCGACGERTSDAGGAFHVHQCKKLNEERIARHDHIVKCVKRAAQIRYVAHEEQTARHSRHRPDLNIYTSSCTKPMYVDVSVTFAGNVTGEGKAIARVEQEKRAKYNAIGMVVEPFVIAHTGEFGPSALAIMAKILPPPERGQWMAEIRRVLLEGNLHVHRAA